MTLTEQSTPPAAARPAPSTARRWLGHVSPLRDFGVPFAVVLLAIGLSLSTDTFLTTANLINVLDQSVVIGLVTCGATLCIISGAFDMSSGAVAALSAIAAVKVTQVAGVGAGFAAVIVVGGLLGMLNGLIVVGTRVHSFIATLATSIVFRGLAIIVTAGAILYPAPAQAEDFRMLTWPSIGGLTSATIVLIAVVATTWLLLARTTFGRRIYAVGGSEAAAQLSGIRVARVRVAVFIIAGICAGLAGLVLASRGGSAQASLGEGLELSAIAATVVGGTSVMGGQGAIWRGVIGVLLLTLIGNGFNLLGWNTTYQQVVQGVLILAAVTLDQILRRRQQ